MVWPSTVKVLALLVHRISTAMALRPVSASVPTQPLPPALTQWTLLLAVVSQLFAVAEELAAALLAVMLAPMLVGVILVVILIMTVVQESNTPVQVMPAIIMSCMHPTLMISFPIATGSAPSLPPGSTPCSTVGDIDFIGGASSAGRLKVCDTNYRWKTVCSTGFDNNEATVICRSLGLSTSSMFYY